MLLVLFAILTQNQPSLQRQSSQLSPIPSLAYADKIKLKNKSLINDISEQVVNLGSSKNELQNLSYRYFRGSQHGRCSCAVDDTRG